MEHMNQLKKDYVTPQERLTRLRLNRKKNRKKMSEILKRLICRIKSLKGF